VSEESFSEAELEQITTLLTAKDLDALATRWLKVAGLFSYGGADNAAAIAEIKDAIIMYLHAQADQKEGTPLQQLKQKWLTREGVRAFKLDSIITEAEQLVNAAIAEICPASTPSETATANANAPVMPKQYPGEAPFKTVARFLLEHAYGESDIIRNQMPEVSSTGMQAALPKNFEIARTTDHILLELRQKGRHGRAEENIYFYPDPYFTHGIEESSMFPKLLLGEKRIFDSRQWMKRAMELFGDAIQEHTKPDYDRFPHGVYKIDRDKLINIMTRSIGQTEFSGGLGG